MKRGWRNESVRHGLAAKGVKTSYLRVKRSRKPLFTDIAIRAGDTSTRLRAEGAGKNLAMADRLTKEAVLAQPTSIADRRKILQLKEEDRLAQLSAGVRARQMSDVGDVEVARALNVKDSVVAKAGTGTAPVTEASIQQLEAVDFTKVDKSAAKKAIQARINVELAKPESDERQGKLKFLRRARELVDMDDDAILQETTLSQEEKARAIAKNKRNIAAKKNEDAKVRRAEKRAAQKNIPTPLPSPQDPVTKNVRPVAKSTGKPDKRLLDIQAEVAKKTAKAKNKKAKKKAPKKKAVAKQFDERKPLTKKQQAKLDKEREALLRRVLAKKEVIPPEPQLRVVPVTNGVEA